MFGSRHLTLDATDLLRFRPQVAPTHAVCFAADDPAEGGVQSEDEQRLADNAGDDPSEKDWKAEYVNEVTQSRRYRQRAQKAEADLEQLRNQALTPQQHEEYRKLRLSAGATAEKDRRIGQLEGMVRQVVGRNELSKTLISCGVGSQCRGGDKMLAQAAALLADRIDVDLSAEGPAVRVLDAEGQAMLNDDGEPVTIQQFVAHWLAEEGGHFLPPSGDVGSGAHKGGTVPPSISIETLDRDPKAKADFIARHGPQAYVQLAQKTHR